MPQFYSKNLDTDRTRMHSNALIIFARKPEVGKVKTRLAAALGDDKALEIYLRLLNHTHVVAAAANCDTHIFLTSESTDDFWKHFAQHLQDGNDLGERMVNAFAFLFARGYHKVVIIGSDCPLLTAEIVDSAFELLSNSDVVVGPARDGGYYLLGMHTLQSAIFQNKSWSTGSVLAETVDTFNHLGLSYCLLGELSDVDEAEDVPEEWL